MNLMTEIYKNREPVNNSEGYLALNPDKASILERINQTRKKGGFVILEVGFGGVGGINLEKNDLYIGVEPYFGGEVSFKVNKAERGAGVIVLDDSLKLPKIRPDLFLCIAPNPNDIDGGMLYEYEKIIEDNRVPIVIVTDLRTREANSGPGATALKDKVCMDLEEMGRRNVKSAKVSGGLSGVFDLLEIDRSSRFQASRDLGEVANVIWSEAR